MKKTIYKKILLFTALLITVFGLSASAATLKLSAKKTKTKQLAVAQTITLKVPGKKAGIKWKSSKKAVAAVNGKGVVTAKKAGKAVITAKVGKTKYKCKITVKRNLYKGKDFDNFARPTVDGNTILVKVTGLEYTSPKVLKAIFTIKPIDAKLILRGMNLSFFDNAGKAFFISDIELTNTTFINENQIYTLTVTLHKKGTQNFRVIDLRKLKEASFNYRIGL